MKTKALLIITLSLLYAGYSFAQKRYSADDLKNSSKAINNKSEWYTDQIRDNDLKNATRAQVRKDGSYINLILDSDLKNATRAKVDKDKRYIDYIQDPDLRNATKAEFEKNEWYIDLIQDPNLRNATKSKINNSDWYADQISDSYYYSYSGGGGRGIDLGFGRIFYSADGQYRRRFNIQAGAWFPLGNLTSTFFTSFHLGLRYAFPIINENNFIDMGTSVVLPRCNKPFQFYDASYTSSTAGDDIDRYYTSKVYYLLDFNLWYRHQKQLSTHVYWDKYIGMGYDMLFSDRKTYGGRLRTGSSSIKCGADIRYQAIGAFLEFNYIFYNRLNELPNDFGGAILIAGINIRI